MLVCAQRAGWSFPLIALGGLTPIVEEALRAGVRHRSSRELLRPSGADAAAKVGDETGGLRRIPAMLRLVCAARFHIPTSRACLRERLRRCSGDDLRVYWRRVTAGMEEGRRWMPQRRRPRIQLVMD
jgi:hypothetical protein